MPVTRTPEQVVFEDCYAIWSADSNRLGQGAVKAKFFVRRGDDQDESSLGNPKVVMELSFRDQTPMQDRAHGEVVGSFRIIAEKDRRTDIDEIAEAIRVAFNASIYRAGTDTDYRPGDMMTDGTAQRARISDREVEYFLPFQVYVARQTATELPQLQGAAARLTYTVGSGGVAVLMGVVEGFEHSTLHQRVGVTPDTAPNTPQFVLGPGVGSVTFRAKVTAATSASSGTPNPRVPDGIAATLVIYKSGTSGQAWTMSVLVESMQHVGSYAGGQTATYRLVRTGAVTETLA